MKYDPPNGARTKSGISGEVADLLFAIEGALPFVKAHCGDKPCSSWGGPIALQSILKKYDWDNERWKFATSKDMTGGCSSPGELHES